MCMTNAYILYITYGPTGPKLDHEEFFLSIARTLIDKVLRTSHFNTPHVRTENLLQTDSNGDHFPEEIPRKEGTKRKPSRPCFERTMDEDKGVVLTVVHTKDTPVPFELFLFWN